jgi:hypothetical protein
VRAYETLAAIAVVAIALTMLLKPRNVEQSGSSSGVILSGAHEVRGVEGQRRFT